jgi:putative intracellular protease/amidase
MKVAMLIAPKDFKDESVSKAKLMLEKWGIGVTITSYSTRDCVGYHGAVYRPDMNAARIDPNEFDAIILIDGKGVDDYKLYDFRPLLDTVKLFQMKGKPIAAINNAIKIIARANIITNIKIAMPKDEESRRLITLYHGTPSRNEMEDEKNILTLSNSDKVYDFADMIVTKLGAK